jgi:transcription-repair coupling factor (superfamily II helicase)
MNDFHHQRFNVLVCTTIIETGIDIPTANTIIIERADHFGLAQLTSCVAAWDVRTIRPMPAADAASESDDHRCAKASRSDCLAGRFRFGDPRSGIRGAGELLGEDQSGSMETIGFSLYMELLENAVDALKAGENHRWKISPASKRSRTAHAFPAAG